MDCKVYVGGLPNDATSQEIEDAFYRFGRIRKVWVARRPPGFAFVEFEDSRDAEDAVKALDGSDIIGGSRAEAKQAVCGFSKHKFISVGSVVCVLALRCRMVAAVVPEPLVAMEVVEAVTHTDRALLAVTVDALAVVIVAAVLAPDVSNTPAVRKVEGVIESVFVLCEIKEPVLSKPLPSERRPPFSQPISLAVSVKPPPSHSQSCYLLQKFLT
ncbi:unnamed protein product [Heligmosomoides polygyrus]|uniref:RRM domain-containing protein n=1 Tax=Heligmosomoides polygyrus TaxID=6339 RepID=A0A183G590_HELPZ|nr:unnamed protein product [Heligmosomoides polygyrus]